MSEYRISNSMYKRIQERKSRLITWLFICAALQLGIVLVYAFGGRDGIILGCILEPILLFLVWKSFRHDIRSVFYKNKQGKILFCDIDRYVNRSISGVGVRGATYNSRTKINYILNVSTDEGKIIEIPLPDKDAYLCYKKDDEVLLISYLPYPVITNRIPKSAVCPQCGKLLHYEDGACHNCGLENIYETGKTPKREEH